MMMMMNLYFHTQLIRKQLKLTHSLKIPKDQSEVVNRRTENKMFIRAK